MSMKTISKLLFTGAICLLVLGFIFKRGGNMIEFMDFMSKNAKPNNR